MLLQVLALLVALSAAAPLGAQTDYPLTPDSERRPGVPAGKVIAHRFRSEVSPGTVRDYWVYVPAQYRSDRPAALMVFQDGGGFVREDGRWRVPVVLDNLVHEGAMPVTIGVFVDPGVLPSATDDGPVRYDRSLEYDSLGDRYARFLLEELLPEVGRGLNLTSDPDLPGHRRLVLRRDLRLHGGLEPAGRVPARPFLHRLLHEPPAGRAGLSLPHPKDGAPATARVPPGLSLRRDPPGDPGLRPARTGRCPQTQPQASVLTNVVFGGPELDTLYVTAGDKVFRRRVRRHGVFPWQVTTRPRPRL